MNFVKNILSLAPFLPLAVRATCMDDASCGDPFGGKPAPNGLGDSEARRVLRGGKPSDIDPVIGTISRYLAYDAEEGVDYEKNFELRKIGTYIELWVATDTSFPDPTDCRNLLGLTQVTDAQLEAFAGEFDTVIYPELSTALSVPPVRDGKRAGGSYSPWEGLGALGVPPPQAGLGPSTFVDDYLKCLGTERGTFQGNGERVIVLVDNIRDKNFYDPTHPDGKTFLAGFVSTYLLVLTRRHVFTIDVFDWIHRTGESPPDDTNDGGDYDACAVELDRPVGEAFKSRPRGYEGVFAHEFVHLLSAYIGLKDKWLEEGIAEWAVQVVGYDDPTALPFPGSLEVFHGFEPEEEFGGPENSLTQWVDQGEPEILADYGAAYSFILFLEARFGASFIKDLHNDPSAVSVSTFQGFLDTKELGTSFEDLLKEWQVALVTYGAVTSGGTFGSPNGSYTAAKVEFSTVPISKINWDTPQAYDSPGAPTNGADFIRLCDGAGDPLPAGGVSSISFSGEEFYPPYALWTQGVGYLFSGKGDDPNTAIVREVDITLGNIVLTLAYDIELLWDFMVVQIFDDVSKEWVSIGGDATVDEGITGNLFEELLPGLTGTSAGFPGATVDVTYDASVFASKTGVKVALRYLTDSSVQGEGVYLFGMSVDGTDYDVDIGNWDSFSLPVEGWSVSIVSYTEGGSDDVIASEITLDSNFDATLALGDVGTLIPPGATGDVVGMIISAIDTTGTKSGNAGYTLEVNSVAQGN